MNLRNLFISCLIGMSVLSCMNLPKKESTVDTRKLEEALELYKKAVKENQVLGYQILVAHKGETVLHEAGGIRTLKDSLPMTKRTLINVASNTKSLVALAIMKLAEEGKIALEDLVCNHLSGFEHSPSNLITIEQLLLHLGGFMDFSPFDGELTLQSEEYPTAPSLLIEASKIGERGPEEMPGTIFRYNNMGYNILGAIIEKVSGFALDIYLKQNFYEPLEMKSTFHLKHQIDTTIMAKQYYRHQDSWEEMEVWFSPMARANGGTISTAEDFAKLFQMLVNGGKSYDQQILEASTIQKATAPVIAISEAYLSEEVERSMGLPDSEWYEFRDPRKLNIDKHRGYGFVVSDNGAFSHAGIYGTFAYADPKEELVIILFTQSIYGGNPGQEFIELIYEFIQQNKAS